jgi:hypothetical protein
VKALEPSSKLLFAPKIILERLARPPEGFALEAASDYNI